MDVTVVIPAGPPGHWRSLVRAVASARSQTHRPAEVIVVVDRDTAYFRRIRRDLPGVTVLENDRGPDGSRDTGAFYAVTELIAFLADDVIADPEWLTGLAGALRDPAVVGAGGGVRPDWRGGRPRWLADELTWTVVPHRPAFTAQEEAAATHIPGGDWAKVVACFIDGEPVDDMHQIDITPITFALVNALKEIDARLNALEAA